MSPTDCGWLVLACPLVGTLLIVALGWRALPGRAAPAGSRSAAIGSSFAAVDRDAGRAPATSPRRSARWWARAFTYVDTAGFQADLAILVDPLSVLMCLVVSGVSFLIHLYSVAYMTSDRGLRALLRLPQLLRVLDAAAGPGGATSCC